MGRYDRQIRLDEVGRDGQARICTATAEVRGCDGNLVELCYLERAGFQAVMMQPHAGPPPFVHEQWFRFAESRRVAAGAWRALDQIRRALGIVRP